MTQTTNKGIEYGWVAGENDWGDPMNTNLRRLDGMAVEGFSIDPTEISGLDVTVKGGAWFNPVSGLWEMISDTDITLPNNVTRYIELNPATGVVSAVASAFTVTSLPIAVVVTVGGEVTSVVDWRVALTPKPLPDTRGTPQSGSGAIEIDLSLANINRITLTGAVVIDLQNPRVGQPIQVELVQGGAGSYTATWPGNVVWPGGVAPTLTTTVGRKDVFTMVYNGTNFLAAIFGLDYADTV